MCIYIKEGAWAHRGGSIPQRRRQESDREPQPTHSVLQSRACPDWGCQLTLRLMAASLSGGNPAGTSMECNWCPVESAGANSAPHSDSTPCLGQRSSGNILKGESMPLLSFLPPATKDIDTVVNEPRGWEKHPRGGQRSLAPQMTAWSRVPMPSLHCLPSDPTQERRISIRSSHCHMQLNLYPKYMSLIPSPHRSLFRKYWLGKDFISPQAQPSA